MILMRSAAILIFSLFIWAFEGNCQESIIITEDSYIRGGEYSQQNYGSSDRIEVKSAPPGFPQFTRRGYLKFDLAGWEKKWIGEAILMLYAEDEASFFMTASLTQDMWEEKSLTWNNAPVPLGVIDSIPMNQAEKSYKIDITSAFYLEAFGDETLSVVLEDKAMQDGLVKLMSSESGQNPPGIILTPSKDTLIHAPELNYAHLQGNENIALKWQDHSNNEIGFEVERKVNNGPFVAIDTLLFNTVTCLDTVSIGNAYFYRVRALNPVINSGYSEEIRVDLSASTVPDRVKIFSGHALQPGSITLYWAYAGDAEGFIISREEESGFVVLDTLEYSDTTYTDYGRTPFTSYRYYLEAFNFLGRSLPSDTIEEITLDRKTYYFDASSGDDNHPENSKDTPWRTLDRMNGRTFGPGDSILLKSGEEWTGQIMVKGSGTSGYPITLSRYGQGTRPVINGDGYNGPVVTLQNVSYWNISDLELTNPATTQGDRLGILIKSTGEDHGHIHLDSLYIHDIFGRYSFQMIGKNTGGIGIIGEEESRFDDILIENCEISDIVRVGIFTNGNQGIRGDRPITNLVIRNNNVSRCAGDGMIIRYADKPLIEHNLAIGNHNGPEELVEFGVAIWVRSTDEAVIQYNRVFDTRGSKDGQAFDADLEAYRTLVQYNYTRNNEGGFMLVYGSSSEAIVRYNISQNDGLKGKHLLDFPVWVNPRGSGIIHNNLFYIGEGIETVLVDEALPSAKLYNNIVINHGPGRLIIPSEGTTATFSHNSLVGYSSADTIFNQNPIQGDPLLADPGHGASEISSLDGYRLTAGSPCIGSGIPVSQMEGNYWLDGEMTDFWGASVPSGSPDVGVHQLSGATHATDRVHLNPDRISWEVSPIPFRDGFCLRMEVANPLDIQLKMYDIKGIWVDTLYSGELNAGLNILYVNRVNRSGRPWIPGAYLLQLTSREARLKESKIIIHD